MSNALRARYIGGAVAVLLGASSLAACGNTSKTEDPASGTTQSGSAAAPATAGTVTITDHHGEIEVPVNPARVVALDNTVFQTLSDWNIPLVAAPKGVIGNAWPVYSDDAAVLDVGNHREPNLEAVIQANPDLIIGGYRFADYYDDLKKIQPATIEINADSKGDQIQGMKDQVTVLGEIFGRQDDAAKLAAGLDESIANAKSAYKSTDTVIGLITSGGEIAYAAPGEGRSVGLLFPTLGLTPAFEQTAEDSTHGDDISVEAIAQANPEWLVVLDRDGAFNEEGYVPAKELIEGSEALKNVPAVKKGQVVYLDPNFYLDEGIQAYTALFTQVGNAFAAAK